jgi:hypothetical protein
MIKLIKNLFISLFQYRAIAKCKKQGHEFIPAGSCPFTGGTYITCTKCGVMDRINEKTN